MKGYTTEWILCPNCGSKTRTKICKNTVLEEFPLFCPKCKHEILINVENSIVTIIEDRTITKTK